MATCPHAERLIPLLHDGELAGPLRREMRSHLSTCLCCARALSALERGQELLSQVIDEEVEAINFANFWRGVEDRLGEIRPSWAIRFRLWVERWHLTRPLYAPAWAVAATVLLTFGVLLQQQSASPPSRLAFRPPGGTAEPPPVLQAPPGLDPGFTLVSNQAEIESISSSETVAVWSDPGNNSTVIWTGSDMSEGMP
jgi:anti-sigma factor RsiW